MFGRKNLVHILPGKKNSVVGVLPKALELKEREGKLLATPIDVYYKSQVSNGHSRRDLKKVTTLEGLIYQGIVICKNCQILWQRVINAGKNMYHIAEAIWIGGQRPRRFARSARQ
ncbi:hypothetical protein K450DRAFT_255555 [Umbelopsis ramanniana AG]|uniref:Uncharacterized protein n=1 Tax=Umbelopsis ramanniana AG TaxID=1314678 RepID=A0AAD5E4U1_UMBRA|nr:uncharacterized protein K450DRAFT_255555 [Umbelopsis ramanniana AG]KAI8576774.1 hypothetical protein K450DRAFT_255555 [Umbelopsis ramanniana AG]